MLDRKTMAEDLGLNTRFAKSQEIPVCNCWHFSTDGNVIDRIFFNREDFVVGMNRIFIVLQNYECAILAFCLMDNHLHFILYGDFEECNRFMHEYVRRTSIYISNQHKLERHLGQVPIHYQKIEDQRYLKTAICYVIKNPPGAGLPYTYYDYPWSSGALYFRSKGEWTSPGWTSEILNRSTSLAYLKVRSLFRADNIEDDLPMVGEIVFTWEYIEQPTVEMLFKTERRFTYFLNTTKEIDIDSKGGDVSRLSIPDSELTQRKRELCLQYYGLESTRTLSTDKRLFLCRILKSQFNCSSKQLARVCGLRYSEVKGFL